MFNENNIFLKIYYDKKRSDCLVGGIIIIDIDFGEQKRVKRLHLLSWILMRSEWINLFDIFITL